MSTTRRRFLRGATALCLVAAAGCSRGGGDSNAMRWTPTADGVDVAAGPPGNTLRFRPEVVEVATGEPVTWRFDSPGHNVSCVPDHHRRVSLPDGAEPFASYDGGNRYATDMVDETFTHAFEVPGEYVYVCVPHAGRGMVGTVHVEA